ncbi:MAG: hypothetical protein ACXVH1_27925, partial [Solirubrobacteraceae bacterium]
LVQGRGTSDCRYEHELQIRFSPRSLPGGSISVIVRKETTQVGISLQIGTIPGNPASVEP